MPTSTTHEASPVTRPASFIRSLFVALAIAAAAKIIFDYPLDTFRGFAVVVAASVLAAQTNTALLTSALVAFLKSKQLFIPQDVERAVVKLNLLRIIVGALILCRTYYSADYMLATAYTGRELLALVSVATAALLLTLGLATPLATLFLLISYRNWVDVTLNTYTLSSDVMQMILLVLFFAPSGTALSLDRRFMPSIYALTGRPTAERIGVATFFGAMSYGILCLYSALQHCYDDGWQHGYAIAEALTAAATSLHFGAIRDIQAEYPAAFFLVTKALTYAMVGWEALFILLVLWNRFTRAVAVIWGLLFIFASEILLKVGWLGSYEFAFWALLFWQRFGMNVQGSDTVDVFYDDRCNLCDRTVRFIRLIDLFTVARLRPLSANKEALRDRGIPFEHALTDLIGVDPKTGLVFSGYDFYLQLSKRILFLMPLWPLLALGKYVRIGPALYRIIADHRTRWFGVCTRSSVESVVQVAPVGRERPFAVRILVVSYAMIAVISLLRAPPVAHASTGLLARGDILSLTSFYGITPISVFNQDGLPLAENFFTISSVSSDGRETLIPFFGASGEYGPWQIWSDRAFYADGLRWRSSVFRLPKPCYDAARDTRVLKNVIAYAGASDPPTARFVVRYFHENGVTRDQWNEWKPVQYKPVLICTAELDREAFYCTPSRPTTRRKTLRPRDEARSDRSSTDWLRALIISNWLIISLPLPQSAEPRRS